MSCEKGSEKAEVKATIQEVKRTIQEIVEVAHRAFEQIPDVTEVVVEANSIKLTLRKKNFAGETLK